MKKLKKQENQIGLQLGRRLQALTLSRPVTLMEVCGTHTHALFHSGIRHLLPPQIKLLSGPGCPVCVTPPGYVDLALKLTGYPDLIIATFGDMVRVPGTKGSLQQAKAAGADIRIVYSPLDALTLAADNPLKKVVFLAVGFETTAPAVAATILRTAVGDTPNLLFLTAHKLVPNVLRTLFADPRILFHGLILPGHVCAVTGWEVFNFVSQEYDIPAVVAGFEPVELLAALLKLAPLAAEKQPVLENLYGGLVSRQGNKQAKALLDQVFYIVDSVWRGIGSIPESGLSLKPEFAKYDARLVYGLHEELCVESTECQCGEILKGIKTPPDCPLFEIACNPEKPVGPCMVSSEGTCAAYYKYNT